MRLRTLLPVLALAATVPACSILPMSGGGGTPPEKLTVLNESGETLFYLYARPSGSQEWSGDLLKDEAYTMSDGERGTITLPTSRSCTYDFRGTDLSASKEYVATRFDVCKNRTLTVGAMR